MPLFPSESLYPSVSLFPAGSDSDGTFGVALDVVIGAYMGGAWRDLSDRLRGGYPVRIRRGKGDGARQVAAGQCRLVLADDDGALTPLNPLSDWYPHVRRGVRYRVHIRRGRDRFAVPVVDGWGVDETSRQWTVIGTASNYNVSGGSARQIHGVTNQLRTSVLDGALADTEQLADISTSALLTGGALVTGLLARWTAPGDYVWLRVEFDRDSTDVQLKISRYAGGVEEPLAALDPVPGLAYAAGQPLRVRALAAGSRLAIRVWNPATQVEPLGWTLTATDTGPIGAGAIGVQSWLVGGNTNPLPVTVSVDNYELLAPRAAGVAASYRPRLVPTTDGMHAMQQIEVAGILRRYGQRTKPLKSSLWRELLASNPIAMWPVVDGANAARVASALPGGDVMTVQSTKWLTNEPVPLNWKPVSYGSWLEPLATAALETELRLFGSVRMAATATAWSADYVLSVTPEAEPTGGGVLVLLSGTGAGSVANPRTDWLFGFQNGLWQLIRQDHADGLTNTNVGSGGLNFYTGQVIHARVITERVGANVDWEVRVNNVTVGSGTLVGSPWSPLRDVLGAIGATDGGQISMGFITIWDHASPPFNAAAAAVNGRSEELAAHRLARVGLEEGIDVVIDGDPDTSAPMGPQPIDSFIAILRDCEAVDGGTLYEPRFDVALGYRTRTWHYNQVPALTVDLATYATREGTSGSVLTPVYDDQGITNAAEVSRPDGSSVVILDQASIDEDELYDEAVEVNAATDEQLTGIAAWRVHLGTTDEYRNPGIALDLAANPELIDAWTGCDTGSRVQRTNPPYPHPPDTIDQLLDGYEEVLNPNGYTVAATGQPAAPWTVGVVEDEVLGRADTDGSELVSAVDSDDATMTVASTVGEPWITTGGHAAMFPFDVEIGGERVTVTAVDAPVRDAFGRVVPVGWGTPTVGPAWVNSGGAASDQSVNGSKGIQSHNTVNVLRQAVIAVGTSDMRIRAMLNLDTGAVTGNAVFGAVLARLTDLSNYYNANLVFNVDDTVTLHLFKRVAGVGAAISGVVPVFTGFGAGQQFAVEMWVAGSVIRAKAWAPAQQGEPLGWMAYAEDTSLTTGTSAALQSRLETGNTNGVVQFQWDDFEVRSPQNFTVTRSANGVQKSHSAEAPLSLWTPMRAAL